MNKHLEIMGMKTHFQLLTVLVPDPTLERSNRNGAARTGLFYTTSSESQLCVCVCVCVHVHVHVWYNSIWCKLQEQCSSLPLYFHVHFFQVVNLLGKATFRLNVFCSFSILLAQMEMLIWEYLSDSTMGWTGGKRSHRAWKSSLLFIY